MANYLPVLLISLTNAIPDDSSLTTAPRAQVDYLSHEWQEEDVWRSWRNMTRQKNAIANGARLENASWRTWWKQRNNLGTVSPETLNWLKDSDVTWLYGPLHTAADWKPPSTQQSSMSNPATAAPARPNSPSFNHPRRSNAVAPYKPILKHRSISELLTSELTVTSPVFSPIDSEEDSETTDINSGDGSIPPPLNLGRPALLHTKSDTLVTRWGSSRTFRRGSPSRIDSPEVHDTQRRSSSSHLLCAGGAVRASHSQDSNSSEKSAASGSEHSQTRHKKKHISFNTFVEQCIAIDKPKKNASGYFDAIPETPWLGERTTWVDDAGYEEDQEDSEEDEKFYVHHSPRTSDDSKSGGALAIREDSDSPDDDDDDPIEIRPSSSRSTSTLRPHKNLLPRSQSKVSTTSSSSSSASTSTTSSSQSDTSTYSATDNTSPGSLSPSRRISSSSSIPLKHSSPLLGGSRHVYRRSSTTTLMSTYRPSLHRILRPPLSVSRSPESNRSQHVTIAPIAPTLLKTTPTSSWTENFEDDGAASGDDTFSAWAWGVGGKIGVGEDASKEDRERERDGGIQRRRSWTSGYGADSYGFAPGAFGTGRGTGSGIPYVAFDKDEQVSDGTPVELVYVPPFEYGYPGERHVEDEDVAGSQLEEQIEESTEIEEVEVVKRSNLEKVYHHIPRSGSDVPSSSTSNPIYLNGKSNLPTVVIDKGRPRSRHTQRFQLPTVENEDLAEDPYDYFGGPDMGDDYYYYSRRGERGYDNSTTGAVTSRGRTSNAKSSRTSDTADRRHTTREQERSSRGNGEERQSRSRSRSESRTPSPAMLSSHSNNTGNVSESGASGRNKTASSSTSNGVLAASSTRTFSQSDLLPLPARGRQLDAPSRPLNGIPSQQDGRRGRSATRASSSSSSWDRDRESSGSLTSTSPMGSLSPDGIGSRRSAGPSVRNGFAVLGTAEREKDREFETGRERSGRERTSSKVLSMAASPADQSIGLDASFTSATSSSSSSNASTIVLRQVPSTNENVDPKLVHIRPAEKILSKKTTPTPSNSPLLTSRDPKFESLFLGSNCRTHTATTMPFDNAFVDFAQTPPGSGGTIPQTGLPSSNPFPIRSSSKFRPPLTLRPTPPSPAKPSTSFTAVSPTVTGHPTTTPHPEHTIVGKAVDIVSSAGMYLGLWARERSASAPSSPI